ncbi:MAG TPA: AraC family ligand binding domain-containing protein, partial [Arachidicoccus sp.]
MKKEKIPVYDICNLMDDKSLKSDFLIERLHHYLDHHYSTLHTPHRHSFFHLVLFTKGKGEHTIDFEKFKVEPFQIYFMIPGQVHGWNFEKDIDGFVINFSDTFFRSFLLSVNYLERFIFLNGTVTDGCFRLPDSIHKTVVDMLEEMLSINEKVQQSKEEDWLRIALLKFFMTISDRCFQPNKNAASSLKHQLLHDFRRLIEKHFHI